MLFNKEDMKYYKNKYERDKKVIDAAKKVYDAFEAGKNFNDEEKKAALFLAIIMIEKNNKNILDLI